MSLKRFIVQKDTTIVAPAPGQVESNYGKDEILELGKALEEGTVGSTKVLLRFKDEDLKSISSFVEGYDYRAKVHLGVATASNLPDRLVVVGMPLSEDWDEGFGKSFEIGNLSGATWTYRKPGIPWNHPGAASETYDGEYAEHVGTDSEHSGGDAADLVFVTVIDGGSAYADARYSDNVTGYVPCWDIEMDITDLVKAWSSSELENNGLVLFLENGDFWANEYGTHISLFSKDTHTIYQPYLEIGWDDSEFDSDSVVLTDNFNVVVPNLQSEYVLGDRIRVVVESKKLYPSRVFSILSLYKPSYVLPRNSLWGIKDEYTNEMVVAFDQNYTKISSQNEQNYFDLDTNMLYPERFYRLLFKVPTETGNRVVDNKIIFKVIRDGRIC